MRRPSLDRTTSDGRPVAAGGHETFEVDRSADVPGGERLVSPDAATCSACLRELFDPTIVGTATRSSTARIVDLASRSSSPSRTTAAGHRCGSSRCAKDAAVSTKTPPTVGSTRSRSRARPVVHGSGWSTRQALPSAEIPSSTPPGCSAQGRRWRSRDSVASTSPATPPIGGGGGAPRPEAPPGQAVRRDGRGPGGGAGLVRSRRTRRPPR